MTTIFSEKSPERCTHYARFFEYLTVVEANLIFWSLFILVLILLCTASSIHHKLVQPSILIFCCSFSFFFLEREREEGR
ncbi:hypothetical protein GcM3_098015 [Golovinomyces cichoracearum]|uniref:Uncharacterized protein n=1 Tax=Golovinomyces cichoracearum TaxID=62708 RepID=A0A420ICG4_9PEZI|nr:hypothetical protein GcM3_098015 [Golovinomyces cichoracearum]